VPCRLKSSIFLPAEHTGKQSLLEAVTRTLGPVTEIFSNHVEIKKVCINRYIYAFLPIFSSATIIYVRLKSRPSSQHLCFAPTGYFISWVRVQENLQNPHLLTIHDQHSPRANSETVSTNSYGFKIIFPYHSAVYSLCT
jgi:hypothetical protein